MSDLDSLYFCKNDDNTCDLKESCRRFLEAEGQMAATLFKAACTKNNNYVLYIQKEGEEKNEPESESEPESGNTEGSEDNKTS